MPDSEYFFALAMYWEDRMNSVLANLCMEFALAALLKEK